jgi:rhamnulokinase
MSPRPAMLLLPDLIGYWLTGSAGTEITNASTTQAARRAAAVLGHRPDRRRGLHPTCSPPLREPGTVVGPVPDLPDDRQPGGRRLARHGVAVVGVPARVRTSRTSRAAPGRWSGWTRRAGAHRGQPRGQLHQRGRGRRDDPVPAQRDGAVAAAGVDAPLGRRRARRRAGGGHARPAFASIVDPDDPVFLPPGDMPARIAATAPTPATGSVDSGRGGHGPSWTVWRWRHRRAVRLAQELSGHHVDAVHVVGGGARNALLCQLTADACGLPVLAGPSRRRRSGNVLVQARAAGVVGPDLAALRAMLRDTSPSSATNRPATNGNGPPEVRLAVLESAPCRAVSDGRPACPRSRVSPPPVAHSPPALDRGPVAAHGPPLPGKLAVVDGRAA